MLILAKRTIIVIVILVLNQEQVKFKENSDESEYVLIKFPRELEVSENSVSVETTIRKGEKIVFLIELENVRR